MLQQFENTRINIYPTWYFNSIVFLRSNGVISVRDTISFRYLQVPAQCTPGCDCNLDAVLTE